VRRTRRVGALTRGRRFIGFVQSARALAVAHGDARAKAARLSLLCSDVCALHGLSVDVEGPLPDGPALLVANHVSYVDPVVVLSFVRGTAIAKHEVSLWPFVGERARRSGTIFVRRDDGHSGARALLEARRALKEGVSVLSFPEGTTTDGDRLLPFKRGVFGLGRALDVPVIPIHLSYTPTSLHWTGDAAFLPHYVEMTHLEHARARIAFGEPLSARLFDSAESLAARAHRSIRALAPPSSRVVDAAPDVAFA